MEKKEKKLNHYLHSFCLYPSISFETQREDEKIILVLRAHPITQLFWIINTLVFVLLLFVFNLVLPLIFSLSQTIFINMFFVLCILSYVWFNFLNWFFNVGVVTDKRIIDIDFHGILYKELTDARLGKVEDLTSKSGGYFQSLFNYGHIFIQTAGTEANVEFFNVPDPSGILHIINGLLGKIP